MQCAGFVRCEPDDDYLVRCGRKDLSGVRDAIVLEGHLCDCGVEIELQAIALDGGIRRETHRREVEVQISQCLVARHASRDREHVADGERLCLCDVAGEQQFANARDGRSGLGIVAVTIGFAVPDRLLVQLEAIQTGHAEDHRT